MIFKKADNRVSFIRNMLCCFLYSALIIIFSLSSSIAQDLSGTMGASRSVDLTDHEKQWIKEHPVIRVTNGKDWAPIDFVRWGEPAGFAIDYLDLISQKTGLKFEYVNGYTWGELADMLKTRQIDLTHSLIYTREREEYLDYTEPYLELPMAYFGRSGDEQINGIEGLVNKRIGYVRGNASVDIYKKEYPNFILKEFASARDAVIELSAGNIDVFINRIPTVNYIISQEFISNVEIIGRTFYPLVERLDKLHLATRNDWPELSSIVKKGMAVVSDEEYRDILNKWQIENKLNETIDLTYDEQQWLSQNKVIRVSVDPAIPPVEFIDENGNIRGIAGSYLELIAEKLGVRFEWAKNENFSDGIAKIIDKEADIVSAIAPTPDRKEYLTFTDTYLNVSSMIFAREGGEVYADMEELIGHKIAQVKDFELNDRIRASFPGIEIIEVDSVASALKLVSSGIADAHIGSIPITTYNISAESITNITVVGVTPFSGHISMAIRSELPYLASAMNKAMNSITQAERAAISRGWLTLRTESQINYKIIVNILIGASIVVVIFLMWNISLRREIKRRQEVEEELHFSRAEAVQARNAAELARASAERALIIAEKAQMEAENANEAKSSFLANMSHEIRTPLNAIVGFSEVMISGIFGEIKEKRYIEYLNDIKASGEHLATVIKDILDLSKIEAGKWKLDEKEFSLNNCAQEAAKMLQSHAMQKNIKVSVNRENKGSDIYVFGDMHTIKRALINVLSNAVKFTGHGGEVSCTVSRSTNGAALVIVKDNGIGIPKDRLEKVLNPFEQAEGAFDLNEEGTGLGLSIVKQLVELHNGEFILESEVGVGTQAYIILPPERVIIKKPDGMGKKRKA